jgi:hypothetical protein
LVGVDNYVVVLFSLIFFGVTVPIVFYNLLGKKYLWFLFSTKKESSLQPAKRKEPAIRTADLRIPPLHSTVNNI